MEGGRREGSIVSCRLGEEAGGGEGDCDDGRWGVGKGGGRYPCFLRSIEGEEGGRGRSGAEVEVGVAG